METKTALTRNKSTKFVILRSEATKDLLFANSPNLFPALGGVGNAGGGPQKRQKEPSL
jgi:hypothetical protein